LPLVTPLTGGDRDRVDDSKITLRESVKRRLLPHTTRFFRPEGVFEDGRCGTEAC